MKNFNGGMSLKTHYEDCKQLFISVGRSNTLAALLLRTDPNK
jgi:hypothetical protein